MARLLVLGAGGPAGFNVCKAAAAAGHEVIGIDSSELHLHWASRVCASVVVDTAESDIDRLYLLSDLSEGPTVAHAQPDALAALLSRASGPPWEVPWRSLMPPPRVMELCGDKFALGRCWYDAGLLRVPPGKIDALGTDIVAGLLPDYLHIAADTFGLPYWLRATKGAGARGATLVENLETAYHWIRYWQSRGVDWEWVAHEYLPGRDFCWTSVWREGSLLAAFARERLEWIYPHLAPSGRTGTPVAARVVHDDRINDVAAAAVYAAAGDHPHGVFCVDLVEDRDGVPRPTEINAGRFATTSTLYMQPGDIWLNLVDLYVRAALGEIVEPRGLDVYREGWTLLRHIDCGNLLIPPGRA